MNKYDVIILGAGPGGYRAAENLARNGLRVALIEKEAIGGTCLNKGCIPLKTFLHVSKSYEDYLSLIKRGILIDSSEGKFSMQALLQHKNRVVADLRKGLESKLSYYKIDVIYGEGRIKDRNKEGLYEVLIDDTTILQADKIIISYGSEPMEIFSANNKYVVNSNYILDMDKLPSSILIIGAGVIGLEIACFLNSVGTEVIVVEMNDILGAGMDREISNVLSKILQRKGIKIYFNTRVEKIDNKEVICNDGEMVFHPELVLEAIGRKASFQEIELERIGVKYNKKGIVVDEYCKTTAEGVYACGDVIGSFMLAHAAYMEADVISANILGQSKKTDYSKVPMVIYTHPELSWVGETEETCKEKNLVYKKVTIPMAYSGRYMAEHGKDNAIFKILYEANTKCILGAHMIGDYSSEIILSLETMICNNMTLEGLKNLVYPHPTVGEIIIQALENTEE